MQDFVNFIYWWFLVGTVINLFVLAFDEFPKKFEITKSQQVYKLIVQAGILYVAATHFKP